MEREELMEVLGNFKGEILSELRGGANAEEEKVDETSSAPEVKMPELKGRDGEIVNQIVAALEAKHKSSAEEVYKTMFNERVAVITTQYPAFGEYLRSKDDFGDVILDRVNKISDYTERVKALDRLFKNFAEAQPSNAEDMRLSKEVKEQVRKDEEKREEIKAKFLKGELSQEEFTDQFFGSLESQIERIRARGG